jgi:hypothetical protein
MRQPNHTKAWFLFRVGKEIYREPVNLFNQPIKIESEQHARALHLAQQEKGYKYTQKTTE